MTPQERKSLAEQITGNPLFVAVLDEMTASSIERLIYAKPEDMAAAQLRVQAVRTFRADLMEALGTRVEKGAPA